MSPRLKQRLTFTLLRKDFPFSTISNMPLIRTEDRYFLFNWKSTAEFTFWFHVAHRSKDKFRNKKIICVKTQKAYHLRRILSMVFPAQTGGGVEVGVGYPVLVLARRGWGGVTLSWSWLGGRARGSSGVRHTLSWSCPRGGSRGGGVSCPGPCQECRQCGVYPVLVLVWDPPPSPPFSGKGTETRGRGPISMVPPSPPCGLTSKLKI